MTFLNPLVLFGLAAAAIPVILHLLNLRKLRTIEFSTLTFLKELQQTKIRRLKLRQMLLLIVRTLLVIFIILAFARPALRGTFLNALGTRAHLTLMIILDDSFSMQASDEHGERFKQATEAAEKLTEIIKEGDEVLFIKLSDLPKGTVSPATHDINVVRTAIREAQVSSVRRSMGDALTYASAALRQSTNVNKEVYFISDMQQTLFLNFLKREGDQTFDEQTKIFLIPIESKEAFNASIDSVAVKTAIIEKDKPVTLYTSIRNFAELPLQNYVVNAYLDGAKSSQSNVSITPFGSATFEVSVIPKRTGFITGYIELENDAIEIDNRRYFSLYIPDRINIAIVGIDDTRNKFMTYALHAESEDDKQSLLTSQQVQAEKLGQLDLKRVDVLVCSNVSSFALNDVDRIKGFVENGGGLVLFPGSDISIENYNSTLLPALTIPPIEGINGTPNQDAGISFQKIDLDHPLFATIFEQDRLKKNSSITSIESPTIRRALHRQAGKRARTIIGLSDGSPFLTEHIVGRGKVLFYSSALTLDWSDFPLKGLFAPLIYRSMIYVSPKEHQQFSYITGMDVTITIPNINTGSETGKRFSLKAPDGIEETLHPTIQSTRGNGFNTSLAFTTQQLKLPGIYQINNGTAQIAVLAVNVDRKESDPRTITQEDLARFWKQFGIELSSVAVLKPGDQIQTTVLQSRFGTELWKYCIFIALIAALFEMLIARDSRNIAQQN